MKNEGKMKKWKNEENGKNKNKWKKSEMDK